VVVCSDHGFHPADAGIAEDPADLAGPAAAWHRPYGIVGVAEAGALTGARRAGARDVGIVTPLDVAPTILHAAGLPVPTEMTGRVVADLLPDDAARREVARAPSPAWTPPAEAAEKCGALIAWKSRPAIAQLCVRCTKQLPICVHASRLTSPDADSRLLETPTGMIFNTYFVGMITA